MRKRSHRSLWIAAAALAAVAGLFFLRKAAPPEAARLLLVDPLPAGLEIDNPKLLDADTLQGLAFVKSDVQPVHTEFRDDRFVAAFDRTSEQPGDGSAVRPRTAHCVRSVVAVRLPLRLALLGSVAVLRRLALVTATPTVVVVLVAGRRAEVQQAHRGVLSISGRTTSDRGARGAARRARQ